jgi:hypothetical protein
MGFNVKFQASGIVSLRKLLLSLFDVVLLQSRNLPRSVRI